MKALLINSSPRIHGNTANVFSIIGEILEHNAVQVETVALAALKIEMCLGCRKCFDEGENACPRKDDLSEVYHKIISSDLIIIGGPIYVEDINGILKNWIDRMAFNCHRPGLFNQKAYIVLTSGSSASAHAVQTADRALMAWGMNVLGKRKLVLGAYSGIETVSIKYKKTLEHDMNRIIKKCMSKNKPSFLQIMTFAIQQRYYRDKADKQSNDYKYWNINGLLEADRYYYSNARINTAEGIAARTAGRIIMELLFK
jgi:multimeric flavodoxin WrbA